MQRATFWEQIKEGKDLRLTDPRTQIKGNDRYNVKEISCLGKSETLVITKVILSNNDEEVVLLIKQQSDKTEFRLLEQLYGPTSRRELMEEESYEFFEEFDVIYDENDDDEDDDDEEEEEDDLADGFLIYEENSGEPTTDTEQDDVQDIFYMENGKIDLGQLRFADKLKITLDDGSEFCWEKAPDGETELTVVVVCNNTNYTEPCKIVEYDAGEYREDDVWLASSPPHTPKSMCIIEEGESRVSYLEIFYSWELNEENIRDYYE